MQATIDAINGETDEEGISDLDTIAVDTKMSLFGKYYTILQHIYANSDIELTFDVYKNDRPEGYEDKTTDKAVTEVLDDVYAKRVSLLERKWGKGLSDDDYGYLEAEYQGWAKTKDVDNKSVDLLIREVCLQQLKMRKIRENGDDVEKKDVEILTSLMDKCSITPDKEKESSSSRSQAAFGVWLKDVETLSPAEWVENQKLFKDVEGIDDYVKRTYDRAVKNYIGMQRDFRVVADKMEKEAEDFYAAMKDPKDETPISYGLNSRLVKENGRITEKVWKVGGLYSAAIEKIVEQLRLALPFAENDAQRAIIEKLIAYYETGDLKTFDAYSILWVEDTTSEVDFVNGFIETYGDPLGMKASWESTVNFINKEATKRTKVISDNAQWFEDHSPVDKRFKKEAVKGVSAKVITVSMLGGDCYPATPIGINLPNADWIRRDHGSKSVTIENITEAYDKAAQGNGFNEEFVWSDKERDAMKRYGFLTDNLHTDLHECLGHGSGKLLENTDPNALKAYSSTLEEARADLFGLYYLADPKLVELGLLPDAEAYESEYYKYVMNGLMTQLVRIELGKDVEEAHMRNRQLIAKWVYEQGKADNVIELRKREGKTYVVVNDYPKLRVLFGKLLAEVQRIKSEGDFEAGKNLVEGYGVKVDPELHAEVLERYAHLNLAPYKGFVNPVMREVKNEKGEVTDIVLDYTEGYVEQMLRYSRDYSFLPTYND